MASNNVQKETVNSDQTEMKDKNKHLKSSLECGQAKPRILKSKDRSYNVWTNENYKHVYPSVKNHPTMTTKINDMSVHQRGAVDFQGYDQNWKDDLIGLRQNSKKPRHKRYIPDTSVPRDKTGKHGKTRKRGYEYYDEDDFASYDDFEDFED